MTNEKCVVLNDTLPCDGDDNVGTGVRVVFIVDVPKSARK